MATKLMGSLLCGVLVCLATAASATPLTLRISGDEGGRQSRGNILRLEQYMAQQGCPVHVDSAAGAPLPDLVFNAKPASQLPKSPVATTIKQPFYEPLVSVRTWQDAALTSSILVKSATGLTSLAGLKGQRIAYVDPGSYMGGQVAAQLLSAAQVKPTGKAIYITGGYEGSMTMLLHGDVYAAVIAGPLARRWAGANDLTIIAESAPLDIGYLWVRASLGSTVKTACRSALVSLQRESRRDKRMKVFPLWVEGFNPLSVP